MGTAEEPRVHCPAWQTDPGSSGQDPEDTEPQETLASARGVSIERLSCLDLCEDSPQGGRGCTNPPSLLSCGSTLRAWRGSLPGQPEGAPRQDPLRRSASSSCVSLASRSLAGGSQQSKSLTQAGSGASSSECRIPVQLPSRFGTGFGRAEKTPQHKRWEKGRTGHRWRSPTRNVTPLAKRKAALVLANQTELERFTRSPWYEFVEAIAIIANALIVVLDTERRAELLAVAGLEDPGARSGEVGLNLLADLFCIFFAVSLVLRAAAEKQFFRARDRFWNACDVVVVVTAILESIARWHQYATQSVSGFRAFAGKFSMLRIVRLLRIVRGTRSIRVSRFIREFCIMVNSLTSAIKPLCWSVVLMSVVLLVFGVFLADGVIAFTVQHGAEASQASKDLMVYFDTLSSAVLTLYMAMSGGLDWIDVWRALRPLPWEYGFAFLAFIAFSILALLNVITAVFVETVMQRSQKDRDLRVQQEMERKVDFSESMQRVFEELDANSSGTLTLEEFEKQLEDENVLTFLSTLELDINQVRTLLTLLDRDQNGEVDIEEFITGCLRLKGGAKSLDMAILQYQVEWILHNMACLGEMFKEKSGSPF